MYFFFFFQAEDGLGVWSVRGFQTCALPIFDAAEVDLLVDRRRIDPATVRLAAVFAPFSQLDATVRTRRDAGSFVRLHWRFPLLCVDSRCVVSGSRKRLTLPPARIVYRPRGGGP